VGNSEKKEKKRKEEMVVSIRASGGGGRGEAFPYPVRLSLSQRSERKWVEGRRKRRDALFSHPLLKRREKEGDLIRHENRYPKRTSNLSP